MTKMTHTVTPEIEVLMPEVLEEHRVHIEAFVRSAGRIDHMNEFQLGQGVPHRAVKIHVTEAPLAAAGEYSPYPWAQQGTAFDPFLAIEDETGSLVGFQHAAPLCEMAHEYGILMMREDRAFLVHLKPGKHIQGRDDLMDAEDFIPDDWTLVEIFGDHRMKEGHEGALGFAQESPVEGEFRFSKEEMPILVSAIYCFPAQASVRTVVKDFVDQNILDLVKMDGMDMG